MIEALPLPPPPSCVCRRQLWFHCRIHDVCQQNWPSHTNRSSLCSSFPAWRDPHTTRAMFKWIFIFKLQFTGQADNKTFIILDNTKYCFFLCGDEKMEEVTTTSPRQCTSRRSPGTRRPWSRSPVNYLHVLIGNVHDATHYLSYALPLWQPNYCTSPHHVYPGDHL